jgi:hypothetical protein
MRRHAISHPMGLVAIAALVVNDHLLKARWPGFCTGKLSDAAGMVVFPLLLFAAIESFAPRRATGRGLAACAFLTAAVFAVVKTWPTATHAFAATLGALQWPIQAGCALATGGTLPDAMPVSVVTDPTDLLALPFAALVVFTLRGRSSEACVWRRSH